MARREMKFVLVTGASGFLGLAVVQKLLSLGVSVRALVRSDKKWELLRRSGVSIVVGDIRDSAMHAAIADVDTVIHCAATIGSSSISHEVLHSINVEGTRNLVNAIKDSPNLHRFVHVSSVAVVGETDPRNPADEQTPCRPLDAYGEAKLLAEQIVRDAAIAGFPAVIARPMWIYGSRSPITTNLFRKIALRKLPMIGPARNTMQPVAIDDAVAGVLKCAVTDGIEGCIYNIAGPEILTIRSMCETIAQVMGTTVPRLSVPLAAAIPVARISELLFPVLGMMPPLTRNKLAFFLVNNSYSIERARRELGWNPTITFERGARQIAGELKQLSKLVGAA